ncbi:MAG: SNF2 family DNA or RNA helicase [Chlamydiales bacterium]|jgi:SNF2 family DNA or RNA helicase
MLNFRKLKQDFSPAILKEGKQLFTEDMVESTKIIQMNKESIRLNNRVSGNFDNTYESELEIDRMQSIAIDSNCDCPYSYDCQHLAAVLYHLEKHFDNIVVAYSKETDLEDCDIIDEEEKEELREAFEQAESKELVREDKSFQHEILEEYRNACTVLGDSPFFTSHEKLTEDSAELAVIFTSEVSEEGKFIELQLALRLPFRSKPLNIPDFKVFCEAVAYQEPLNISGRQYLFNFHSFDEQDRDLLRLIMNHSRYHKVPDEKCPRTAIISTEAFGHILSKAHQNALKSSPSAGYAEEGGELPKLSSLYCGNLETPIHFSHHPASLRFEIECLETPAPKLFLTPRIVVEKCEIIAPKDALLMESVQPGMIHENIYYRFPRQVKRIHLQYLDRIRGMAIPEPLFGTFVENSLPELLRFAEVTNQGSIEGFVTLPFVGSVEARCDIHYLDGELDATLYFIYDQIEIPTANKKLNYEQMTLFTTEQGILARNLNEEQAIIKALFQDFTFNEELGVFSAKTEKRIVEFMTEVVPKNQGKVTFNCPENLLDQFIYDKTHFTIKLKTSDVLGFYEMQLKVDGDLKDIKTDLLWECLSSKKRFIELQQRQSRSKKRENSKLPKILVLDLEKLSSLVQIFDDLGIKNLDNQKITRPLWSLAAIHEDSFNDLPISFSISKELLSIKSQILGETALKPSSIPKSIANTLRTYQREGVDWLDRLRRMHLNGILADDMGLGKTLQAITAITQYKKEFPNSSSLVVCPTSLLYNWKAEFSKFNPELTTLIVDGTPTQRKKLLNSLSDYDVIITSYTLLQKDIETYQQLPLGYAILDEAQHIKNRGTRNAKSVKMILATHRLILTGTPIENSLEELWSLFDFLMPGLLSSYNRFVEKYIRSSNFSNGPSMDELRRKITPFILRRMKSDVLKDLPPVSNLVYHCHLTDVQQELYRSYAESARAELTNLVAKEGFDKVQIHVLATLTRLKQICCHPAIFAKEEAEEGDSAKYEMLMELLQTLIEGGHKTVIFSQYTKMLNIMRKDLEKKGIRFSYLDGSSKNRLGIVNHFNENDKIPVFLVSLKAGGSGLNITGADTVIHYDMWWNPAVENQATDRVHRIGQSRSVSSYKLVTLNTIEEKILQLQNRKKGLVKQVISNEDEAMSKLTWEEVLELLQS